MSLVWLAAVLQPHDIAPHPNFRDQVYDRSSAPLLAASIQGDAWRYRDSSDPIDAPEHRWLSMVERCFDVDTTAVGVSELSASLLESPPNDASLSVALTLVNCSAAAELDDYDLCFQLLNRQLVRLTSANPEGILLQAAVLQQLALRRCDVGDDHLDLAIQAGLLLTNIDLTGISSFPVSPGVSWKSSRTVEQMTQALLEAAVSLVPWENRDATAAMGLPTRFDLVKERPTDFDYRLAARRAEVLDKHVSEEFKNEYKSGTQSIWAGDTDLFHTLLLAELMGDGRAYPLRREVATLRLARGQANPIEYSDSLRLLRQSGSPDNIDLVVRRLRYSGPLSPLVIDARQIMRSRAKSRRLRTVELKILSAAADLMSGSEAGEAFEVVKALILEGGPKNLPMHWQVDSLRNEAAWVAASSLARVAGLDDEAAAILLRQAEGRQADDQLAERAVRRAVAPLDWKRMSAQTRRRWATFVDSRSNDWPDLRDVVYIELGLTPARDDDADGLRASARSLNGVMLDLDGADLSQLRDAVPAVLESLQDVREEAQGNSWSMRVIDAADLAAGMLLHGFGDAVGSALADFLLDPRVQRADKDAAFERLSRADSPLSRSLISRFYTQEPERLVQMLSVDTSMGPFMRGALTPWPALLRFLAIAQLVDFADIFDGIATLAASRNSSARTEGARTVALLADKMAYVDLIGIALTLAGDPDASVRAHSGRALVKFARAPGPSGVVARRRLLGLLRQDGILAPTLILRALGDTDSVVESELRSRVKEMSVDHPSYEVRREALMLLAKG